VVLAGVVVWLLQAVELRQVRTAAVTQRAQFCPPHHLPLFPAGLHTLITGSLKPPTTVTSSSSASRPPARTASGLPSSLTTARSLPSSGRASPARTSPRGHQLAATTTSNSGGTGGRLSGGSSSGQPPRTSGASERRSSRATGSTSSSHGDEGSERVELLQAVGAGRRSPLPGSLATVGSGGAAVGGSPGAGRHAGAGNSSSSGAGKTRLPDIAAGNITAGQQQRR
jgi:hypothetical protein